MTAERDDLDRAQRREEDDGVLADDDGDGGGGAAGRDPVAPADDEAGVVAEGAADEDVLPAGARHAAWPAPRARSRRGARKRRRSTQTARYGQKFGRCWAISPGVRRMPAPMMLPIVTARPKPDTEDARSAAGPTRCAAQVRHAGRG